MRSNWEGRRVRGALMVALVLVAAACARPTSTAQTTPTRTPSPSPTPTAPLSSASAPFHDGEVGAAYTPVVMTANGGVHPYTWSISAGALPGGLALSQDGSVSGTPTASGRFRFTVEVADAGGSTSTLPGEIHIADAPVAQLNPNCAQQCSVESGCVTVCGDFGSLSGGTAPISFVWSGSVPAGTTVQGFSVSGTFTTAAVYQFTVTATDAFGLTASVSPIFYVFPHISLSGATCNYVQLPCNVTLKYAGGTPGGSPSLQINAWAPGPCSFAANLPCPEPPISGTAGGGNLQITIGPVPANYPYPYPTGTFTVYVRDQSLCSAGTYCASDTVQVPLVWTG